jgi:hypothetical protein
LDGSTTNFWHANDNFCTSDPKISTVLRKDVLFEMLLGGDGGLEVIVVAILRLDVCGVSDSSGREKRDVSPPRIVSGPVCKSTVDDNKRWISMSI